MGKSDGASGGVGLLTVIGVVFIILKLTGVIHWSWLWVLSPFILGLLWGLLVLIIILGVIYAAKKGKV